MHVKRFSTTVVSVPFGCSKTNTRMTSSGRERITARLWNGEKAPGVVVWGGGSEGQTIWCETIP